MRPVSSDWSTQSSGPAQAAPTPPALSRRKLCQWLSALTASTLLPPIAVSAQDPPEVDEGAISALAAAANALAITGGWLAGGSGGLRQLANSTASGRQALASQLTKLLDAVAAAQGSAATLPESERPYLRLRFPEETRHIAQAARNFADYLASGTDPAALAPIKSAAGQARRDLSGRAEGKGITAAILMALAFAAEYGAAIRLTNDPEALRALLEEYRLWSDAMRTQADSAIPFRRLVAEQAHDQQLTAFGSTPYGRRVEVANFLIEGSQAEKRIADPCVIVATYSITFPFDNRAGVSFPSEGPNGVFTSFTPNVIVGFSRIRTRDDDRFGAKLIQFSPGSGFNYALSNHFLFHPGVRGEYCYVVRSNSELSTQQAISRAGEHPSLKEDRDVRTNMIAAVKNANACRIEIALSGRVLGMLRDFDSVREFYERPL